MFQFYWEESIFLFYCLKKYINNRKDNSIRCGNKNSFLIITHYQRLLDYIKPDFVHVLMNGRIIKSGGPELAEELEKKGYESFN